MLFDSLDRMKRSTIMLAIILVFVGWGLLMVPEEYVPFLSGALAFVLLVSGTVSVFTFLESPKALISYFKLFGGLLAAATGFILFAIDGAFLVLLSILVIAVPALLGLYGIFHAFAFAKRSGRQGWWVLVVFSVLLLCFAAFGIINPWSNDVGGTVKLIGGTLMYSALITALSLVWIWPFNREEA